MSNYLKYDVECLENNRGYIEKEKESIKANMDNITTSINDLKSEWDTKEAQKVYDMVDDDWQEGVNATVEALGDLAEAIKGAKAKYAEIEINAYQLEENHHHLTGFSTRYLSGIRFHQV